MARAFSRQAFFFVLVERFVNLAFGYGEGSNSAPGVGIDLGLALLGAAPLDFLSHRLQHLDYNRGSMAELLDASSDGLLLSTQRWFWRLLNTWSFESKQELEALKWWAGSPIDDLARSTFVGLAAAVWCRLEIKRPGVFKLDAGTQGV